VTDQTRTLVTLEQLIDGAREKAAETPDQPIRDGWLRLANAAEQLQRAIAKRERRPPQPVH
jgi:uncharacterized alpha-E superfamily protein